MIFSFNAAPDFDFMTYFARHIGATVESDMMVIPLQLGDGSIRKLSFGPEFKVTLHHYLLKEDLIIKRNASGQGNELITIFFYSNEQPLGITYGTDPHIQFSEQDESAIQVTSNDLNSTIRFPAGYMIHYMVIAISPAYLKNLIALKEQNTTIETITGSGNSFLFLEKMTADIRLLQKNLGVVEMKNGLSYFYMHIKVQELLYLLFERLSKRESIPHQNINSADAARLLHIRNEVLSDLSTPPVLSELAGIAAMSETKLKQLFKQAFGDTIYNYFQQARMEEAAFMLKQGKRSVAEVGYELGFTNLSHFSRLFERHYGLKPKKYGSAR
ncbi:helix-turn-helix domain-containing protein [Pedobacter sp. MR2016-24]|uniref:helix-turn-helix domain-containing protein n=1 Tax=Pedobacter sp. MR2016-24 TaxID=2994466 RepID=UPI002248683F|nr:AraC family transcriptional regulator [Pedobacter sp. MR2016-24]MCX2483287.1 AraC family transcriptional regulator [Pedobacter sp. MR2016-24]